MSLARVALGAGFGVIVSMGALAGCRSDGGDGSGAGSSTSSGPGTGGGGVGGSTSEGGSTGEGGGTIVGCEGPEQTVQDITTGAVGPGVKVSVNGVVAMSQKWLVSKSSTGSCLWGVFVSAPGLTTTGPNTGLLALSYGTPAAIPEGGNTAFCPVLGVEPAGDMIPDNVKPGDVLDLVGVTAVFPNPPNCNAPNPDNQVGMLQLGQVCKAELKGTAAVPAPAVLSGADAAKLASTTDKAFHDQWGAVKVRLENVADDNVGDVVGDFGVIKLANGVEVGNKISYRGYLASSNQCHASLEYTTPGMTFTRIDGFHYLNFCSWGLQIDDKCADLDPPSMDQLEGGGPLCTAGGTCEPTMLPGG